MKQEDKELLLKDLSARLPYGVKIRSFMADVKLNYDNYLGYIKLNCFRPYLRPMSSMTEEENKEFQEIKLSYYFDEDSYILLDWLNSHHFDFRNLIERGLAIDCTGLNIY